jgi:hypothetical protein
MHISMISYSSKPPEKKKAQPDSPSLKQNRRSHADTSEGIPYRNTGPYLPDIVLTYLCRSYQLLTIFLMTLHSSSSIFIVVK